MNSAQPQTVLFHSSVLRVAEFTKIPPQELDFPINEHSCSLCIPREKLPGLKAYTKRFDEVEWNNLVIVLLDEFVRLIAQKPEQIEAAVEVLVITSRPH